jgi:hypothetical protein
VRQGSLRHAQGMQEGLQLACGRELGELAAGSWESLRLGGGRACRAEGELAACSRRTCGMRPGAGELEAE